MPTQGYLGEARPREQVAVVVVDSSHIQTATVNGVAFGGTGISLLPGEYQFQVVASHGAQPYGCRAYTVLDAVGLQSCQKEREAEIRKRKKAPKECHLAHYTAYRQTCLRDYRDAACEVTLLLTPGQTYELGMAPSPLTPPVLGVALVSGGVFNRARIALPINGACRVVGTRTAQEDYALQ